MMGITVTLNDCHKICLSLSHIFLHVYLNLTNNGHPDIKAEIQVYVEK